VQSFTAHMPLPAATSAFGLGRRRWSSPQQCYLHCLRTVSLMKLCSYSLPMSACYVMLPFATVLLAHAVYIFRYDGLFVVFVSWLPVFVCVKRNLRTELR